MNDEQIQPLLEVWLHDRDEAPRDANGGIARVMGTVPQVRQRGRWLPFPLFHRKAQTPTATDTTDYRPSPIPASNGHTPILIGRTQTMFSPVKAITAGALVFALGGLFLVAQPFEQPEVAAPGAQSDDGEVFTILSSKVISETEDDPAVYIHEKEASDARLSGTWTEFWGCRGDFVEVCVGSVRVENEGVTWLGRAEWFGYPPLPALGYTVSHGFERTVLEGQGDYTGLTALVQGTYNPEEGEAEVGVIWEGALPSVPEPAE